MTKTPRPKTQQRIAFLMGGNLENIRSGRGIHSIMMSEDMLKTALTMRWWMAAEHWSLNLSLAYAVAL